MDWLAKYQAIIVCAEKIVHIPWGNETLIVHGCPVFLAHVTTKKAEDKSEKKLLEEVPIVRDFSDVFPEDFLGLPPTRQVEFQISYRIRDAWVDPREAAKEVAPMTLKGVNTRVTELAAVQGHDT
ncbi:hypothetical protein Tco_0188531 [Tanacetum coccineum]